MIFRGGGRAIDDEVTDLTVLNDLDMYSDPDTLPLRSNVDSMMRALSVVLHWPLDTLRSELGCDGDPRAERDVRALRRCNEYLEFVNNRVSAANDVVERRAALRFLTERYSKAERRFLLLQTELNTHHHGNVVTPGDYLLMGDARSAGRSLVKQLKFHLDVHFLEDLVAQPGSVTESARGLVHLHIDGCDECSRRWAGVVARSPFVLAQGSIAS